jgi:two-component system, LytTR family, response regulator
MKIRAIIVDDEPHAREGIRLRLKKYSNIQIVEECSSGKKAVAAINSLYPNLIFLDIQMPEMNGFEVLSKITVSPLPFIIFVTAFDKYAIQAFEYHALDYLLKPISEARFNEALQVAIAEVNHRNLELYASKLKSAVNDYLSIVDGRIEKTHSAEEKGDKNYLNRLMIKSREQISMISIDEIDWIESAGDYVYVHSKSQKHIVRDTLTSLEKRLNPQKFIRIHRSAIVNIEQIKSLKPNVHGDYDVFLHNGDKLKLSRSFRAQFQKVTGNSL